ncbi:hypothetical protein Goklo_008165, partial [Gossypium klotzschianum]|nr:hypothetical protein [Gossypium klotzschianum]
MVNEDYRFCSLGRVLTDSIVSFSPLKNTLTDLWHPLGGVTISNNGDKRVMFTFYYEMDLKRVCE